MTKTTTTERAEPVPAPRPPAPKRAAETRLGELALERGLLTRDELEALVLALPAAKAKGKGAPDLFGEALVAGRYVTAELLEELLAEQAARRSEPRAGRRRAAPRAPAEASLEGLLAFAWKERVHELILVSGKRPAVRRGGGLVPLDGGELLADSLRALADEALGAAAREGVEQHGGTATAIVDFPGGRARATLGTSEQGLDLALRVLELPLDDQDQLPPELERLADLKRGLVVIAGIDGPVRNRVLARLVARVNANSRRHVIVIERASTYRHPSESSLVAQREVGVHTPSFEAALRGALREDPDVLVVGDLSGRDAIATGLLAAETGHLVLGAVHAATPVGALERLIDVIPDAQRDLVRATLAESVQAVAAVEFLPGKTEGSYIVADVVPASATLARLIREDRLHQLASLASGVVGGVSRDERIVQLERGGRVARTVAIERLVDPSRIGTEEDHGQ